MSELAVSETDVTVRLSRWGWIGAMCGDAVLPRTAVTGTSS